MSDRTKQSARTVVLLAALLAAVIAGCTPAPPVTLHRASADVYRETLVRYRGNVVLVDFWATWCAPCVELFPHTVELQHEYRDRGLCVISVSMDTPDAEPQVRAFLERHDARFENFLSSYGSPVEANKAFDLDGPLPRFHLYDRAGNLHREFAVDPRADRQFTPTDIEAAIEELL